MLTPLSLSYLQSFIKQKIPNHLRQTVHRLPQSSGKGVHVETQTQNSTASLAKLDLFLVLTSIFYDLYKTITTNWEGV